MPPREGTTPYYALVDPYLIAGHDVFIPTDTLLRPLQRIQHQFLRRLLHLNGRSLLHVLFSETGVVPISHRRLLLTMRFIRSFFALPHHTWHQMHFSIPFNLPFLIPRVLYQSDFRTTRLTWDPNDRSCTPAPASLN